MDSRFSASASGKISSCFPFEQEGLDAILGAGVILDVKESASIALQHAGLNTQTIIEELKKYPKTDEMIDILSMAGLLSQDKKQLVYDLLWACKTIKLRQEMQARQAEPVAPEYDDMAHFMMIIAMQKVLSERLCKRIFGEIAWQQKLPQLSELLYRLGPLNEKKVDFVLDSDNLHAELLTQLAKITYGNDVLRELAANYPIETANHLGHCLRELSDVNWVTADLLLVILPKSNIQQRLQACSLLARANQLKEFQQHVLNETDFAAAVICIASATDETEKLDSECLRAALNNSCYVSCIDLIKTSKIFNGRDGRTALKKLMLILTSAPEICELILKYDANRSEWVDSDLTYDECSRDDDLLAMLSIKLPHAAGTLEKLNQHQNSARQEQRVTQIEHQLSFKCSTVCTL